MQSRPSIYDRLPARTPKALAHKPQRPVEFHADCVLVENAWLRCGSGGIDTIATASTAPSHCHASYDERLRHGDGHYVPIAPIDTEGTAMLDPRERACQLLEQHFDALTGRHDSSTDDSSTESDERQPPERIVIQAPPGVAGSDFLDSVLPIWSLHGQPSQGIEITELSFDSWLAALLEDTSCQLEHLQFVALEPLSRRHEPGQALPVGEMLASLWLRRAPLGQPHERQREKQQEGQADAGKPRDVKLLKPVYHHHEPRRGMPRGEPGPLGPLLSQISNTQATKAMVWDGVTATPRLEQLVNVLQTHLPHLYFDTDLWSMRLVAGALECSSAAAQTVLAYQLARERQGDILLADTHEETTTWAMQLQVED